MIEARARAAVELAHEVADIVPFPPGGARPDPVLYQAWEELMLTAAIGIAESVSYDEGVLAAAVGPKIEVGTNPPWRVLLQIAQLEAEVQDRTRSAQPGRPTAAYRTELGQVVSGGFGPYLHAVSVSGNRKSSIA